jgi:hypothetical protein
MYSAIVELPPRAWARRVCRNLWPGNASARSQAKIAIAFTGLFNIGPSVRDRDCAIPLKGPDNMPRVTVPEIKLALTQADAARALSVRPEHIAAAIDAGHLIARKLPGYNKALIPTFGKFGLEEWFHSWPAAERPGRKVPHGKV